MPPKSMINPKMPHRRIIASAYIPKHIKDAPAKHLESLNPFALNNIVHMKLKKITHSATFSIRQQVLDRYKDLFRLTSRKQMHTEQQKGARR